MASVHRFENYSAKQLATEAEFICWVKCPDEAGNLFWSAYLTQYPSQADTVATARAIVLKMQVVQETMDEDRAIRVWEIIRNRMEVLPAGKLRRMETGLQPVYRWMAAAAVLLFVASGLWFLFQNEKVEHPSVAVTPKGEDIEPGSDKAILTFADGSRVVLDSANNGTIAKEGNVRVVKLNGKVAYNREGGASPTQVLYNTITTPRRGEYHLVLEDGSEVWLNAESSLRFPTEFSASQRSVELTGEGYFEVAHNASKPFLVKINQMEVQVLGTHFNINSYGNEPYIKTTLLEGKVQVKMGASRVVLTPGQQAVATRGKGITVERSVDVDQIIAWKNGFFQFSNTDIQTIMRQLERWYGVEVVFAGQVSQHYNGKIQRKMSISKVLQLLEKTGTVKFAIDSKKIIVRNS